MRNSYKGISINTAKNTHEAVFGLIRKDLHARIVDIPSGTGAFILKLKDQGYKNVLALDVKNILEIDHEDFMIGDMNTRLPLENASVDSLVCIDGIEHIHNQFDFVREANRILKDGGEFILSTPNTSALRSRWKWLLTGHHHKCTVPLDENNPNALHHIGMISFPEMRYLLHTNGFTIQDVTANRIKLVSWIYALIVPLAYLVTSWAYYKEGRKEKTSNINREVKKTMFSKPVLFGETLIVRGIKTQDINLLR